MAFVIIVCICFGLIGIRLAFLQVISSRALAAEADDQHSIFQKLIPVRGEIKVTDRFSKEPYPVATSIEKKLVYVVPASVEDAKLVAEKLSPIIGVAVEDILLKISDKNKKYVPLKRQLSELEEEKIKDLKLSGVAFDAEPIRYYPEKTFLSNVLGYVGYKDTEKTGFYGLEQAMNEQLAGQPGTLDQEKDLRGAWIFNTRRNYKPAINGDNLILTVDKSIELKAEETLKAAIEKNSADWAVLL